MRENEVGKNLSRLEKHLIRSLIKLTNERHPVGTLLPEKKQGSHTLFCNISVAVFHVMLK